MQIAGRTMPRKPTGRANGRPKKDASVSAVQTAVQNTANDTASPSLLPTIPGVQALMMDALSKGEVGTARAGILRDLLADLRRTADAEAALATRLAEELATKEADKAPALLLAQSQLQVDTLTKEATELKGTVTHLTFELAGSQSSAKLWDAQVRQQAEAKAQADRHQKEADAAARLQAKWDGIVSKFSALVAADDEEVAKEKAYTDAFGLEKTATRYGSTLCDAYADHQKELARRVYNRRWLGYGKRLAAGQVTQADVEGFEVKRLAIERGAGLQTEYAEVTRAANDLNAERDPSFDPDRRLDGRNDILRDLDTGRPVR